MKTVQLMLQSRAASALRLCRAMKLLPCAFTLAFLLSGLLSAGCSGKKDELSAPEVLVSPYDNLQGDSLWAVAPLRNESAVSTVDVLAVSDTLVARAAEIRGVACLPMNRTLAAMRALGMSAVRSPADARTLARALGVDAIIVGAITAYDPYDPPKIGLTIGLYPAGPAAATVNPRALAASPRDATPPPAMLDQPIAVASEYLDAQNDEVLRNLRRYATGRTATPSPLGWKKYTASMDLYTDFAAYWSLYRLLQKEQLRVGRQATADATGSR